MALVYVTGDYCAPYPGATPITEGIYNGLGIIAKPSLYLLDTISIIIKKSREKCMMIPMRYVDISRSNLEGLPITIYDTEHRQIEGRVSSC